MTSFSERTNDAGWAYSEINSIEGDVISEHKCHINASFSRYRKDKSLIAKVAALYIVILRNGRWGMNAGSVLTPA